MKDRSPIHLAEIDSEALWHEYSRICPEISQWLVGFLPEGSSYELRRLPTAQSGNRRFSLYAEKGFPVEVEFWQGKLGQSVEYQYRQFQGCSVRFDHGGDNLTLQWNVSRDLDRSPFYHFGLRIENRIGETNRAFGIMLRSTKDQFLTSKSTPFSIYGNIPTESFRHDLGIRFNRPENRVDINARGPYLTQPLHLEVPFWFSPANR